MSENSDGKLCSSSFAYYVLSDGDLMGFHECPEDAFDDDANQVFRRVSWSENALLHPGYGKRIDEVVRMFPGVNNPAIEDGYRVKAVITIGWLRAINVLAGYLQGEGRVRNPEFRGIVRIECRRCDGTGTVEGKSGVILSTCDECNGCGFNIKQ